MASKSGDAKSTRLDAQEGAWLYRKSTCSHPPNLHVTQTTIQLSIAGLRKTARDESTFINMISMDSCCDKSRTYKSTVVHSSWTQEHHQRTKQEHSGDAIHVHPALWREWSGSQDYSSTNIGSGANVSCTTYPENLAGN